MKTVRIELKEPFLLGCDPNVIWYNFTDICEEHLEGQ
jgi:hypothetical protein